MTVAKYSDLKGWVKVEGEPQQQKLWLERQFDTPNTYNVFQTIVNLCPKLNGAVHVLPEGLSRYALVAPDSALVVAAYYDRELQRWYMGGDEIGAVNSERDCHADIVASRRILGIAEAAQLVQTHRVTNGGLSGDRLVIARHPAAKKYAL